MQNRRKTESTIQYKCNSFKYSDCCLFLKKGHIDCNVLEVLRIEFESDFLKTINGKLDFNFDAFQKNVDKQRIVLNNGETVFILFNNTLRSTNIRWCVLHS